MEPCQTARRPGRRGRRATDNAARISAPGPTAPRAAARGPAACRALALAVALVAATPAAAQVGLRELAAADPDGGPFPVAVWYPADAPTRPADRDGWLVQATPDAPPAPGRRRLAALSHGMHGTPFAHHVLAEALARRGWIVVAPHHRGDDLRDGRLAMTPAILAIRPRQLARAIDAALADPALGPLIDRAKIAAIGYSMGGYTALAAAGGRPDLRQVEAYCRTEPGDALVCASALVGAGPVAVAADPRIRTLVLIAPALGFLFDRVGLAAVAQPVQIFRAEADEIVRHPWNEERLAGALKRPPDYVVVPAARHHVFLGPCPPWIDGETCRDPPGVDRRAVQAGLVAEIAAFLDRALPPE